MAPILRSRRSSPRFLVAAATPSTRPYVPIDFRKTRKLRNKETGRKPLRASKQGKRARFLITSMLFDHFVAIYSHSQHQCPNRCTTNCFTIHQSAHSNRTTHGSTSHDQRHPRCRAGACSGYHSHHCCWAGVCSSATSFPNWAHHNSPNRARTTSPT